MAHVTVTVSGRTYKMACRDGEEQRVLDLAAEVDAYVQKIRGNMRLVPEDRLFLMAALMIADQLWDTREELQRTLRQISEFRSYHVIDGGGHPAHPGQRGDMRNEAPGGRVEPLGYRNVQQNG